MGFDKTLPFLEGYLFIKTIFLFTYKGVHNKNKYNFKGEKKNEEKS